MTGRGGGALPRREVARMTPSLAVAIAAFFLGVGMAGEPLAPRNALLALAILLFVAVAIGRRAGNLLLFLFAFAGVLLTCYLQHGEIYPGTGVVGLGLGGLAAASFGRRHAPALIAGLGTVVGAGLFFLL
jgi:hypothetical protein